MNELELELKSIQTGSPNNLSNYDKYTNAIAAHEQRLIELEEEIRDINGIMEELNFKIDNFYKLKSEYENQNKDLLKKLKKIYLSKQKNLKGFKKNMKNINFKCINL